MKIKKRSVKCFVSMLLVFSMLISSFVSVEAKQISQKTVFAGDGFEVTFNVTSQWSGAFNGDITLKNTGDKIIENWALQFAMSYEITSIWNGVVISNENGNYVIKNATQNQDVLPGKSINFGFSAKCVGEILLPTTFEILSFLEAVKSDRYEISYNVTSNWKSAFNGEIKIKNISDKTIEDWKLEFDFDLNIDRFWTAGILEHTGNHYYIKNAGYNSNIKPGETITLGFSGNPGSVDVNPANYILSEIVTEPSVIDPEKDSDKDGIVDLVENTIGSNPYKPDTDSDGLGDYIEYMIGLDPSLKDTDSNGVEDGLEDIDLDGLNNLKEIEFSTNCLKSDTDFDGLLDGEEVTIYMTSPIVDDTDGDTITDGDEVRLGLNPLKAYSDDVTHDSIRSFEQVLSVANIDAILQESSNLLVPAISGSVPNVIDNKVFVELCDNDALQENRAIVGEPIKIDSAYVSETDLNLGFDYNHFLKYYTEDELDTLVICQYSDDNFIPLETNIDNLKHSLNANIYGAGIYFVMDVEEFLNSLGINPLDEIASYESKSFSLHAEARDILTVYDDSNANDIPAEWNEANQRDNLEEVTSVESISEESISEENAGALMEPFEFSILNESAFDYTKGQADITFVIDTTGSMYSAISNVRNNITQFVDRLTTEYNVQVNFALIDYKDITSDGLYSTKTIKNGTSNWFSSVSDYKNKISSLYINGGGDGPETSIDGLGMAANLDFRSNANKFVVLVTDANYKVDNLYGITSMNEMAGILKDKNINTSVIAPTYYRSIYQSLFDNTDGVFADIYGNFSIELMKLADKIGQTVNDGSWVLLSDYQYIKLNDEVLSTNGIDTDEDSMSDYTELGTKEERDLSPFIKLCLASYDIPESYYTGKKSVAVYEYLSNPIITDTDYDGINDNDSRDLVKRDYGSIDGNSFSGDLIAYYDSGIDVDFSVDYSNFFTKGNTTYHKDLSVLGSIYAAAAYHGNLNITKGAVGSGEITDIFDLFGLEDIEDYSLATDYSDADISEVILGHRLVKYKGKQKDIVVVAVRGTNGTIEEWSSNFDVGADTDGYWDKDNPYWRNKINHKGLDVTANRVYDYILDYVNSNVSSDAQKVIYITGHSRGGGISNVLGSLFEDRNDYETYVYTFASPNTTTNVDASSYKTIFNIVNSDDIIPQLPISNWEFVKYGQTKPYTISVAKYYEDSTAFTDKVGTFEWLVGKDYNDDGGTSRTLNAFAKVATVRDDLYEYDMSSDGVVNPHNKYHTTLAGAEKELVSVQQELKDQELDRFAYAYVHDGVLNNVLVRYKPAFLMQVLANMTCGIGPKLGFDVTGKYSTAKTSFVSSSGKIGIGGMASPHCQESYYLIARNNFKALP